MNNDEITRLHRLYRQITPGPWRIAGGKTDICAVDVPAACDPSSRVCVASCTGARDGRDFETAYKMACSDAAWIAAIHHAWPEIYKLLNERRA
jgi:hypothetical protein